MFHLQIKKHTNNITGATTRKNEDSSVIQPFRQNDSFQGHGFEGGPRIASSMLI